MPDISKCYGEECQLKEKCYRFACETDEFHQAYQDFTDSLNEEKTECEHFMKIYKDE